MLVELRSRSQITIPAEILKRIGAAEGDKFEVIEKDGGIFLCPVVVYPKAEMERIAKLIKDADIHIVKSALFTTTIYAFSSALQHGSNNLSKYKNCEEAQFYLI